MSGVVLLATGLGLGLIPWAPGTFGSLLGLPLAWGLQHLPDWMRYLAPVFCYLAGVPICSRAAKRMGLKDPGSVVFDEIAAFSVVFLAVPVTFASAICGFVLFRLFDITKPWPARRLEMLPDGWGIMADDFAAGVYAGFVLWLIARWVPLG